MFTRYSGVDVPQNYSGNRFRKRSIENTEMKVHTNQTQGATKSSVSPTFENQSNNNDYTEEIIEPDTNEIVEPINEKIPTSVDENEDITETDVELSVQENEHSDSKPAFKGLLSDLNLSPFTEYLKNIKNDDLLLIALIIFLASDKNVGNNDIIILLALLLVYHT